MRYHRAFLAFTLLIAAPIYAAAPALFPIHQHGLYGFIDKTGHVVIEPRYEATYSLRPECPPFNEGLQPVRVGENWGYIDTHGELAIPARFSSAGCFKEGLAAARPLWESGKGSRYGYIDHRGAWAVTPRFDDAQAFSEGLAVVQVEARFGHINRRGQFVIPPRQRARPACASFAAGLACFEKDGRWGFMDKRGRTVIAPQFDEVPYPFSEGLAVVRRPGSSQPSGYIDRRGHEVIPPQFSSAYSFSAGRAWVQSNRGYAFIDHAGKIVVTLDRVSWVDPFADGLAMVKFNAGDGIDIIGYVDANGALVILPRFVSGTSFVHGLAFVDDCGSQGYIDTKGETVWGLVKRAHPSSPVPAASLVSGEAIARATGHPGPLSLVPQPTHTACTDLGKFVWRVRVSAADKSFAFAEVSLVEGGTFLTTERQETFDHVLAQLESNRLAKTYARRIAGHPDGFTAVLAFGPDGGALASAIPSPDGAFDLLVLLGVGSDDEAPPVSEATKAYRERLNNDPIAIAEAIVVAAYDALFPSPATVR